MSSLYEFSSLAFLCALAFLMVIWACLFGPLRISFACSFCQMRQFVKRRSSDLVFEETLRFLFGWYLSQLIFVICAFKTHFSFSYSMEYFACEISPKPHEIIIGSEKVFWQYYLHSIICPVFPLVIFTSFKPMKHYCSLTGWLVMNLSFFFLSWSITERVMILLASINPEII